MNQSIHTIDLLYYLAGEVASVCAYADRAIHEGIETEDNAVAIVKFKSGALGVIEGSTSCFSPTGHPAEVHLWLRVQYHPQYPGRCAARKPHCHVASPSGIRRILA